MTHTALATGSIISIRPKTAEEIIPWVELEVCSCQPAEGAYEVGCRFVKTPPYSILMLFG